MKKYIAIIAGLLSLVAYQNCGSSDSFQSVANNEFTQKILIGPLNALNYKKIIFSSKGNDIDKDFQLDIKSGVITTREAKTYCIDKTDRELLESILLDSKLCEGEKAPKDMLCAKVYSPGYAEIVIDDDIMYDLGAKPSSCSTAADLCATKPQQLKNFLSNLIANIDSKLCK